MPDANDAPLTHLTYAIDGDYFLEEMLCTIHGQINIEDGKLSKGKMFEGIIYDTGAIDPRQLIKGRIRQIDNAILIDFLKYDSKEEYSEDEELSDQLYSVYKKGVSRNDTSISGKYDGLWYKLGSKVKFGPYMEQLNEIFSRNNLESDIVSDAESDTLQGLLDEASIEYASEPGKDFVLPAEQLYEKYFGTAKDVSIRLSYLKPVSWTTK